MVALMRAIQRMLAVITALFSLLGIKSSTVTVSLYTNPDSGYNWSCSIDNKDILVLSDSYFEEYSVSSLFDGNGDGKQIFIFRAVGEGTATVTFKYVNSSGTVASKYIYVYSVDEDLKITLESKTSS